MSKCQPGNKGEVRTADEGPRSGKGPRTWITASVHRHTLLLEEGCCRCKRRKYSVICVCPVSAGKQHTERRSVVETSSGNQASTQNTHQSSTLRPFNHHTQMNRASLCHSSGIQTHQAMWERGAVEEWLRCVLAFFRSRMLAATALLLLICRSC